MGSPVRATTQTQVDFPRCSYSMECAAFAAQFITSMALILFCMLMIALRNGQLEVYLPLITSTAAIWVPNPKAPTRSLPPA